MLMSDLKVRVVLIALCMAFISGTWYAKHREPIGPLTCAPIEIHGVDVVHGPLGDQRYFNIITGSLISTSPVVAFDGKFPEDFSTPAALWVGAGRWTGKPHYRLAGACQ